MRALGEDPAQFESLTQGLWETYNPTDAAQEGLVIRLSRASYRKMVQNLAWGAGYNLIAIPLAAGVFSFAGITLSPAVGAILMSASTVVVAFNAQLLRRLDLRPTDLG